MCYDQFGTPDPAFFLIPAFSLLSRGFAPSLPGSNGAGQGTGLLFGLSSSGNLPWWAVGGSAIVIEAATGCFFSNG